MFVLHMFRCSFIYSQVFDTTDEFDSDADSDTDVRPSKSSFATLCRVNARKSVVTPQSRQRSLSPDADNASVHAASDPQSPSADLQPSPHPPVDDQDPAKLFTPKQDRSSTTVATPHSAVSKSSKRKDCSVSPLDEREKEKMKKTKAAKPPSNASQTAKGKGKKLKSTRGRT